MKRVAAGDGQREHPQGDHGRKVERRDAGADAQRLADRKGIDAGRHRVADFALHQLRNAAGEFDHLETTGDRSLGVGKGLAMLGRDQDGQFVHVRENQVAEAEHDLGPLGGGRRRPRREGRLRIGDGGLDVALRGERHLGRHLAGGRIGDVAEAAASAQGGGAADVMAQTLHQGSLLRRRSSARRTAGRPMLSICCFSMISGGDRAMMSPVVRTRSPLSKHLTKAS